MSQEKKKARRSTSSSKKMPVKKVIKEPANKRIMKKPISKSKTNKLVRTQTAEGWKREMAKKTGKKIRPKTRISHSVKGAD